MSGNAADPPASSLANTEGDLDRLLGQLPPPSIPDGLAVRITANVTRLPQFSDPPASDPVIQIDTAPTRRRHWLAWTGGGMAIALAAGLAALLILPEGAERSAPLVTSRPAPSAPATAATEPAPPPAAFAPARKATPRLAAKAIPIPSPAAASPAPEAASPPPVELADTAASEDADIPPALSEDDSALPDTAMAAESNGGAPDVMGQAPAAGGWGYAPGTRYPPRMPDGRSDENAAGRRESGRDMSGRRF
ncbi:MAG TPA: hypothetical protein VF475_12935 [Sphingobium sp.]